MVSRYRHDATVLPHFCNYEDINPTLLALRCEPSDADHEIWITDISWTDPRVDRHLQSLIDRGVRICWIDHHRTALQRYRNGEVTVRLTVQILSEARAACGLTYDHVCEVARQHGGLPDDLRALQRLVELADDNDRWLHHIPGSRDLALAVGAMPDMDAYDALRGIDAHVTFTPAMRAGQQRAQKEIQRSFDLAERSRVEVVVPAQDIRLVTAVCDGYASDIADAWGKTASRAVFAFFDAASLGVSLRRSPDCPVDLSSLAQRLGGGGHAAAAGCELPGLRRQLAEALSLTVAKALATQAGTQSNTSAPPTGR